MTVLCVETWDVATVASPLVAMPKSVHRVQHSIAVFPRVFHCQGPPVDSENGRMSNTINFCVGTALESTRENVATPFMLFTDTTFTLTRCFHDLLRKKTCYVNWKSIGNISQVCLEI